MQSTLCHGVTLKGASCNKMTNDPSQLCHLHRKTNSFVIKIKPVPTISKTHNHEECCVCYEMMPISDALTCKHLLCKACFAKMRSDCCPMCRSPIKMDEKTKNLIKQRKIHDAEERNMAFINRNLEDAPLTAQNIFPPDVSSILFQPFRIHF